MEKDISKLIIEFVGGKDNIEKVFSCDTRVRFILKDKNLVNKKELNLLSGVFGTLESYGQFQIVIGYGAKRLAKAIKDDLFPKKLEKKIGFFKRLFKSKNNSQKLKTRILSSTLSAPTSGQIIKESGKVKIIPESRMIVSPCDGYIEAIYKKNSGVNITSDNGVELSMYLNSKDNSESTDCIKTYFELGEKVRKGDLLFEIDDYTKNNRFDVNIEINNTNKFGDITVSSDMAISQRPFIALYRKENEG